jgi:hypothetical protein
MKTKFVALYFRTLPMEPRVRFFSEYFLPALEASPEVSAIVASLLPECNEWLHKERALRQWIRRSEYTTKIADASGRLDRALSDFWKQVGAAACNADVARHDAVVRLDIVRRNYGYIQRKPYETKASDVVEILEKLETGGERAGDVTLLGLASWVASIRVAYNLFNDLFHARNTERIRKPAYNFRQIRGGIEGVYHRMVSLIESHTEAGNRTEACRQFIETINPQIEYLNDMYHSGRHDIAGANTEAIEPQRLTGELLTPTPKVYFVTEQQALVPLVLGKDYNLSYKYNRDVGNAQCTLHGRGRYKGRKTVTFIIEEEPRQREYGQKEPGQRDGWPEETEAGSATPHSIHNQ